MTIKLLNSSRSDGWLQRVSVVIAAMSFWHITTCPALQRGMFERAIKFQLHEEEKNKMQKKFYFLMSFLPLDTFHVTFCRWMTVITGRPCTLIIKYYILSWWKWFLFMESRRIPLKDTVNDKYLKWSSLIGKDKSGVSWLTSFQAPRIKE